MSRRTSAGSKSATRYKRVYKRLYRDSRVLYRVFFFVPLTCIQRVKSSLSRVLLCSPHPSHFPHFCLQSSSTDDHPIFSRRTAWSATPPSTDSSLLTLCLLACDTLHSSHVARFARVSIDSCVFSISLFSLFLSFSLFFFFFWRYRLFFSLSLLFFWRYRLVCSSCFLCSFLHSSA